MTREELNNVLKLAIPFIQGQLSLDWQLITLVGDVVGLPQNHKVHFMARYKNREANDVEFWRVRITKSVGFEQDQVIYSPTSIE